MADSKKIGGLKEVAEDVGAKALKMAQEACGRIRRLESWIKENTGMDVDINSDGKVGSARIVAVVMVAAAMLVAGIALAETTQLQTYDGDAVHGTFKVVDDNAGTATLTVDAATIANLTTTTDEVAGNWTVATNLIVGGTSSLTGAVTMVAGATVGTTLGVTGVATFTETPVCSDGLTVATNATVGGTLAVTGVATLTATPVLSDGLTVATNATVGGTVIVTGALTAKVMASTALTATSLVLTSAHYGTTINVATNAAVAITLPANGAAVGTWIGVAVVNGATTLATDSCVPTISAATADTLTVINDAEADSVTFGSGQRIGAACRFVSDGRFWRVENIGTTAITPAS